MIHDYSFHVPLLIYAPTVFPATLTVSNLTSHVDIVPTLLDMYGMRTGRATEQGAPLWKSGLADRRQ